MTTLGKLVIGTVVLLIGGGIFYGVMSYVKHDNQMSAVVPSKQSPVESAVVATTSTEMITASSTSASSTLSTGKSGKKIPFTDFMSKGGSYKCTVTQTVANMTSNGIVYIHDDHIRAEFSTTMAGQSIDTVMIARDGYTYSWTNMMAGKGYKAKIVAQGQGDDTTKTKGTYTWNGSQIGDYNCESWTADTKLFELPKGVVFSEM